MTAGSGEKVPTQPTDNQDTKEKLFNYLLGQLTSTIEVECALCESNSPEDKIFHLPCCQAPVCHDCITGGGYLALVKTNEKGTWCSTKNTHKPGPVDGYAAAPLKPDDRGTLLVLLTPAPAEADRKRKAETAWITGGYLHGCGANTIIESGCDSTRCTGCSSPINVLGRPTSEHTYLREKFVNAARMYHPGMPKDQLAALSKGHKAAWDGLYLGELIDFLESSAVDVRRPILQEMYESTWGGFKFFLMQHYAPDMVPPEMLETGQPKEHPEASLGAVLRSLAPEDPDYGRIRQFLDQPVPAAEFQRARLRTVLAGSMQNFGRQNLLKSKLRNDDWWHE